MVYIAWRGPPAKDQYTVTALYVMMEYLTDTAVAPLQREFVEIEDPYCSRVSFFYLVFTPIITKMDLSFSLCLLKIKLIILYNCRFHIRWLRTPKLVSTWNSKMWRRINSKTLRSSKIFYITNGNPAGKLSTGNSRPMFQHYSFGVPIQSVTKFWFSWPDIRLSGRAASAGKLFLLTTHVQEYFRFSYQFLSLYHEHYMPIITFVIKLQLPVYCTCGLCMFIDWLQFWKD